MKEERSVTLTHHSAVEAVAEALGDVLGGEFVSRDGTLQFDELLCRQREGVRVLLVARLAQRGAAVQLTSKYSFIVHFY